MAIHTHLHIRLEDTERDSDCTVSASENDIEEIGAAPLLMNTGSGGFPMASERGRSILRAVGLN
jgi:hypothetical protein